MEFLIMPHSIESEKAVLGACLLDKQCLEESVDSLEKDDFYSPAHSVLFEAISEMFNKNQPVDVVTLGEFLNNKGKLDRIGGLSYLFDLTNSCPTIANHQFYIETIKSKSNLRKIINLGKQLQELGMSNHDPEEAINKAESLIFGLSSSRNSKKVAKVQDFIHDYFKILQQRTQTDTGITGLSTGFKSLDRVLAGLQKSDLIIVAGRPSMGKTALALNISENVCDAGGRVIVFSLEMSKEQLLERMVCSQSRVAGDYIRTGNLSEKQWEEIKKALGKIKSWDLYIDDTPAITLAEIRSKLRKSHAEKPIDLVIIDYLGLISIPDGKGNKADQIGEVTKGLKMLARELDLPIILICQLNRGVEAREDKRPLMSDLRDSGAIEQDADIILLLYRDEYYNYDSPKKGIAEIIIAKQRRGSTGVVELKYQKSITRFSDLQ